MSLDLPKEQATDVEDMLTKLGGRKATDLADLEYDDILRLIYMIPKLQRTEFKKKIAIYRTVQPFQSNIFLAFDNATSHLFSQVTSLLRHNNRSSPRSRWVRCELLRS